MSFLTNADKTALQIGDSNYINNKGAQFYAPETYDKSIEYYHLAAAMGNVQAISNLGYCYLYGRSIKPDLDLAISYFRIAAIHENIDAAYKLGDIYGNEKWGIKDKEMSIYYYRMAISFIANDEWEKPGVVENIEELQNYPSLCYAMGRELFAGENMKNNIGIAYKFLKHASIGYRIALANGDEMYRKAYEGVTTLLADPKFDAVRANIDTLFANLYSGKNKISFY